MASSSDWKERARKDIREKGYTIIAGAKFEKKEAEQILKKAEQQEKEKQLEKVMSKELAKKYYPAKKPEEVVEASKKSIQAQQIREATEEIRKAGKEPSIEEYEKRGITVSDLEKFGMVTRVQKPTQQRVKREEPQPPKGMKEVTFTTEEAMRLGLISRETARTQPETVTLYVQKDVSKQDLIRQSQYLKQKWFDIKRDREQIGKGRVPYETWAKLEEEETKTAERIGKDPYVRTSYVLAKDWLGIGTLHSYAVTKLMGGDWEQKQKEMLTQYGKELMVSQKEPMLKTVTLKSPIFGDVPYQPIATAGMGVKIASFYLMGKSPAIGFGAKAVVSAIGGYEIGTGIRMVAETKGKATPQEAEQIARHFASGFLLTVPAQLTIYGKGIQALQKPKMEMQIAGTKEKFVYEKAGSITTTKSVATEKITVLERKGVLQRLHLRQPTKAGELYGQIRTVSKAGEVLGVGRTQYVYAGKIHGKPIILAGEEPSVSIYQATPETVYGYTYSTPRSMFKILGKPTGDTRAYVVTRFGGTKYAETPKAEYWTMKTKAGGIRETHQILQKQTRFHKFKDMFAYEQFVSRGKGITVLQKELDKEAFLKPVKTEGALKEMKPFTKPPSPAVEVEAVVTKTFQKAPPSVSVSPQTGMGAISGAKQFEKELGTGYEQIGLKGMMDFDMKYEKEEIISLPIKGFPEVPSGRQFVEQKLKVLQTPLQKEMAMEKEKAGIGTKAKEKMGFKVKEGQMERELNRVAQALGQAQAQKQAQKLAQKQRLGLKQMLAQRFFQARSFKSFGRFGTIPAIPTFGKTKAKDVLAVDEKEFKGMKFKEGLGKLSLKKIFFADIYSVTKSHLLFGKATHPALTEKEWGKAEKTFFVDVPTVELKKRGKNILKGII